MTGIELIERLWDSGTGEKTLLLAKELLDRDPAADGAAVREALAQGGAPAPTLEKADAFLDGRAVKGTGCRAGVDAFTGTWRLLAKQREKTDAAAAERMRGQAAKDEAAEREKQARDPAVELHRLDAGHQPPAHDPHPPVKPDAPKPPNAPKPR